MEEYQRRKLYRVHLKNISEIRNCRTPINYTSYSSRLFNFSLKTTFRKKQLRSLEKNSQPKFTCEKRNQQRKTCDYFRQKQNQRLEQRISKASGSINMAKYQKQYEQHKKIMKLHRKVKHKKVILYKIYDITFKGQSPNLNEQFVIFDRSINDKSHNRAQIQQQQQQVMRGNIYSLRNSVIKSFRDQKLVFRIVGRKQGIAIIGNGQKMVPIVHRKQIIGTLILQVY